MPLTKKLVPAYSQRLDVSSKEWTHRACGIVALATIMDFLRDGNTNIDRLIKQGIEIGAYDSTRRKGWLHGGLIALAKRRGFTAGPGDWANQSLHLAFERLKHSVARFPCIASIHKDFDLGNGGHLIVVRKITRTRVLYNEPNAKSRRRVRRWVTITKFQHGWKRRIIIVKP